MTALITLNIRLLATFSVAAGAEVTDVHDPLRDRLEDLGDGGVRRAGPPTGTVQEPTMSGRPRIGVSRYVDPAASARPPMRRESSGPMRAGVEEQQPGRGRDELRDDVLDDRRARAGTGAPCCSDRATSASESATGIPAAGGPDPRAAAASYATTGPRGVSALAMGSPMAPRPTTPTVPDVLRPSVTGGLRRLDEQAGVEELLGVDVLRHAAELDVGLLGVADPGQDVAVLVGLSHSSLV